MRQRPRRTNDTSSASYTKELPAGEADLTATLVLSQLEGALLLARTYRSLEPMHRAERALKRLLRADQKTD